MKLNSRKSNTLVDATHDVPFIKVVNDRVFTNLKADDPRVIQAQKEVREDIDSRAKTMSVSITSQEQASFMKNMRDTKAAVAKAVSEAVKNHLIENGPIKTDKSYVTREVGPELFIPLTGNYVVVPPVVGLEYIVSGDPRVPFLVVTGEKKWTPEDGGHIYGAELPRSRQALTALRDTITKLLDGTFDA